MLDDQIQQCALPRRTRLARSLLLGAAQTKETKLRQTVTFRCNQFGKLESLEYFFSVCKYIAEQVPEWAQRDKKKTIFASKRLI